MLTRIFNQLGPVMRMQDEMNSLLESFFEDAPAQRTYGSRYPLFNAWEDQDAAWIEAELPGLTMDDIEVLVRDDQVTIKGQRKLSTPESATWARRERSEGEFSRTLTLPWRIDADKVEAKLRDGVLSVHLPRAECCKPKKVKVLGS